MPKIQIKTESAPAAIGTYSQAIKVGKTVYLSGQIPLDPENMSLVADDFSMQARQVFENLHQVCIAAGGGLDGIVKLTIYVTDLGNFPLVNETMVQFFHEPFPARATVQVSALPMSAQIEIDAILVLA